MSKSTNNFSGDLLLLAIASPKLSSIDTLFVVTSAKHCSLSESKPSNIWSQTFLSPANNNFTCSYIIACLNAILKKKIETKTKYQFYNLLTAIRMKWIQFPILASKISHCSFWTSSLLSFSTPSFCRLSCNTLERASLHNNNDDNTNYIAEVTLLIVGYVYNRNPFMHFTVRRVGSFDVQTRDIRIHELLTRVIYM